MMMDGWNMKARTLWFIIGGLVILPIILAIIFDQPDPAPLRAKVYMLLTRSHDIVAKLRKCALENTNEFVTVEAAKQKGFLKDDDLAFIKAEWCVLSPFTANTPTNIVILELPVIYEGRRRGRIVWNADYSGQFIGPIE
jgi:hypothetical protein